MDGSGPAGAAEVEHANGPASEESRDRERFLVELEFIQCLANPKYLHWLAQSRYFQDKAFINYLKYLQYWKRPEYSKYIAFPHALAFLDLLQHEAFRAQLLNSQVVEFLHSQQFYHWQHYRNNRLRVPPLELPPSSSTSAPPEPMRQ